MILKPRISKRWDKRSMVWKYDLEVGVSMIVEDLVMEISGGQAEQWTGQAMVRQLQAAVATMNEREIEFIVNDENTYTPPNRPEPGFVRPEHPWGNV